MTVTARQYIALHLHYVEGQSKRRIARTLGVTENAVRTLIIRGRRWIIEAGAAQGVRTLPSMRALLVPSPTSSPSANLGLAASRREELLDALELRLEQRATELAEAEECMSHNSAHPTRIKRNHYDHWEMRYLRERGGEPLPTSAYNCGTAAKCCANDPHTCGLDCYGCQRE